MWLLLLFHPLVVIKIDRTKRTNYTDYFYRILVSFCKFCYGGPCTFAIETLLSELNSNSTTLELKDHKKKDSTQTRKISRSQQNSQLTKEILTAREVLRKGVMGRANEFEKCFHYEEFIKDFFKPTKQVKMEDFSVEYAFKGTRLAKIGTKMTHGLWPMDLETCTRNKKRVPRFSNI